MDLFANRFNVRSAFVRVKTLARILDIGQPTIYSAMRAGSFFLPHRMLGSAPAVKLEDLVDWYCDDTKVKTNLSGGDERAPAREAIAKGLADGAAASANMLAHPHPHPHPQTDDRKARRKAIIDEAMAQLARKR
ncbi:helix-turn-helix transcriptional regulator [Caballeronia sp. 15715]|uniref:helix-turn-helix transcriptional regulator n=1 Tax=Caballeronia sp. 15715 TaxID=3391030 RepID=UPI0039E3BB71